jgi:hypothetical protein
MQLTLCGELAVGARDQQREGGRLEIHAHLRERLSVRAHCRPHETGARKAKHNVEEHIPSPSTRSFFSTTRKARDCRVEVN